MNWLPVPERASLRPPGPLLRWFGRTVLAGQAAASRATATDEDYFAWEAQTADGVWQYYASFFDSAGQPSRILDLASSQAGRTASYADRSGALFCCVDRDMRALSMTAGRAKGDKRRLRFVSGEAYRLPFRHGTFDVCLCENALEHFDRPDAAVAELQRVLREGGLVFSLFPPWRGPYSGHLTRLTRLPWIHLLPPLAFIRLIAVLHFHRAAPASDWRQATIDHLTDLGRHLNGWQLQQILHAFRQTRALRLIGAYVLGEGAAGRWLRFLPWVGECFTAAVYLVHRKVPVDERGAEGAGVGPRCFNDLLRLTLRRRRTAGSRQR